MDDFANFCEWNAQVENLLNKILAHIARFACRIPNTCRISNATATSTAAAAKFKLGVIQYIGHPNSMPFCKLEPNVKK